jgi:WD40 repeat protein
MLPSQTPTATLTATPQPTVTPTITPTATPWTIERQPVINRSNIPQLARFIRLSPTQANPTDPVSFQFSPDSRFLALSNGSAIQIWDLQGGAPVQQFTPPTSGRPRIGALAYSANGKRLAHVFNENQILLWSLETGAVERTFSIDAKDARILKIAFSPAASPTNRLVALASTAAGSELIFWDPGTGEKIAENLFGSQQPGMFQISPLGRLVIQAGPEGILRFWNLDSGAKMAQQYIYACTDALNSISFTQNGAMIALQCSGSADLSNDATVLSRFYLYQPDYFRPDDVHLLLLMENTLPGNGLMDFNKDGAMLAAVSGDPPQQLSFWNFYTQEPGLVLNSFNQDIKQVEFSTDGRMIAIGLADGSTEIWAVGPNPSATVWNQVEPMVIIPLFENSTGGG